MSLIYKLQKKKKSLIYHIVVLYIDAYKTNRKFYISDNKIYWWQKNV